MNHKMLRAFSTRAPRLVFGSKHIKPRTLSPLVKATNFRLWLELPPEEIKRMDHSGMSDLLYCLNDVKDKELTDKVVGKLSTSLESLQPEHVTLILQAFEKTYNSEAALRFFRKMKASRKAVLQSQHLACLFKCLQGSDLAWKGVEEFLSFNEISGDGKLSQICYGGVLSLMASMKLDDIRSDPHVLQTAMQIFDRLSSTIQDDQLIHNSIFCSLILLAGKAQKPELIDLTYRRLCKQLQTTKPPSRPSVYELTVLMAAYNHCNQFEHTRKVYAELCNSGLNPEPRSFRGYLYACMESKMYAEALSRFLSDVGRYRFILDLRVCSMLLNLSENLMAEINTYDVSKLGSTEDAKALLCQHKRLVDQTNAKVYQNLAKNVGEFIFSRDGSNKRRYGFRTISESSAVEREETDDAGNQSRDANGVILWKVNSTGLSTNAQAVVTFVGEKLLKRAMAYAAIQGNLDYWLVTEYPLNDEIVRITLSLVSALHDNGAGRTENDKSGGSSLVPLDQSGLAMMTALLDRCRGVSLVHWSSRLSLIVWILRFHKNRGLQERARVFYEAQLNDPLLRLGKHHMTKEEWRKRLESACRDAGLSELIS